MSGRRRPATALVGAGRLAAAVGPALASAGYPIVAVADRTIASARRLCGQLSGARPTRLPAEAVAEARLVLLAVPDREIEPVARDLARDVVPGWKRRVVLHHAGAIGTRPLARLARRGAAVGVLHPLQCLGLGEVARFLLPGSRARIEGDRRAVTAARRMARDLGLVPISLSNDLRPSDRAAYHAAASMASNDLLALLASAADLLRSVGVSEEEALAALVPLAEGTLAHVRAGGVEGALTGPVARGDVETTARQSRRIARTSRVGAEAHRLLSLKLLDLAGTSTGLTKERRRELRRLLRRK